MNEFFFEQPILDQLGRVREATFYGYTRLRSRFANLASFTHSVGVEMEKPKSQHYADVYEGRARLPIILLVTGFPTSSKSWCADLITQYLGLTSPVTRLGWEISEDASRSKGEITTPIDQPFTKHELRAVEGNVQEDLIKTIEAGEDAVVELPGIPEVRLLNPQGRVVTRGRKLGGFLASRLARRVGPFAKLPPYRVKNASVMGGPILRQYSELWRDGTKRIPLNPNDPDDPINQVALERMHELCATFGKIPPLTLEEMVRLQRQGASIPQILTIRDSYRRVVRLMRQYGVLDEVTYKRRKLNSQTVEHAVLRDFTMGKYNMNLKGEDNFIGYSNPDFNQLNISSREALDRYINQQGYIPEDHYAF